MQNKYRRSERWLRSVPIKILQSALYKIYGRSYYILLITSTARIHKSTPTVTAKASIVILMINITLFVFFLCRPSFLEAMPSLINRITETITNNIIAIVIVQPIIKNKRSSPYK